jgi:hypothetical protein
MPKKHIIILFLLTYLTFQLSSSSLHSNCSPFTLDLSPSNNKPKPSPSNQLQTDLLFTDAIESPNQTIRIPFRLVGRLIVVTASVEGQEGNFILDTGASKLLLNNKYFKGGYVNNSSSSIGATGQIYGPVRTRTAKEIQWDAFLFKRVNADLLDLTHIEETKNTAILGMIGYGVLRDFEIFFDYFLKQIILCRLDKNGNTLDDNPYLRQPIDSLNARVDGHVVVLQATVDGSDLKLGLDSGAEINLLDRNVDRQVLAKFEIAKRINLMGAGKEKVEVLAGTLYGINLDGIKCAGMHTLLTSLDEANSAFGTRLDGVLGFEFFAARPMAINYKKKKLYFYQPEQRP